MKHPVKNSKKANRTFGKLKWFDINWKLATSKVKQYQYNIAAAYNLGNMPEVKHWQS